MSLYYEDASVRVIHGDCIEVMRELDEASVDAVVTDPPYGLGFMGKAWDDLPPGNDFAAEALRVLKPGGHLLAFGGTRTWHRLAVAIEDAGFEIRDGIAWMYGSGFPKSLNVGNAIRGGIDEPMTPEAEQWQGWGTALKPAFEPIVVARKPLRGTVAANVLEFGTGALNVDGCRIGATEALVRPPIRRTDNAVLGMGLGAGVQTEPAGRWPANVILDEVQAEALDEMSGELTSGLYLPSHADNGKAGGTYGAMTGRARDLSTYGDTGGASRFFYTAKADSSERPGHNGTAHPTVKPLSLMRWLVRLVTPPSGLILEPFAGSGTTVEAAILEGFRCVAIEREADYLPLIKQRINRRRDPIAYLTDSGGELGLFDEGGAA